MKHPTALRCLSSAVLASLWLVPASILAATAASDGGIDIGEVSSSTNAAGTAAARAKALRESPENQVQITHQQIRDLVQPGGSIVTDRKSVV